MNQSNLPSHTFWKSFGYAMESSPAIFSKFCILGSLANYYFIA